MDLAGQEPGGGAWVEAQVLAGERSSEPGTSEPKGERLSRRWRCSGRRFKSTLRGDEEAEGTVLLEELWEPDEQEVGGEEGREDVQLLEASGGCVAVGESVSRQGEATSLLLIHTHTHTHAHTHTHTASM